jgi:hypothetical protein
LNSDKKYIAAFVTSILGIGCISYFMFVEFKGDMYRSIAGLVVMVMEMLVMLCTGIILVNMNKTKSIGQGVLIGTGITLVIGFGICSAA